MKRLGKTVLILCFVGFVFVDFLLLLGHGGFAIKISNYLYFGLVLGIVLNYFVNA